jgi:quercetin dioxygenase-like cupin family protein
VPFRHGPAEAVKYSATPSADNPARALKKSDPNALQDELLRHLNEDAMMSSFDVALQFLDTARMTYWGKHRDAAFWVENASVEWPEAQAPFHTVARLTLLPKSQLPQDESEQVYFDVTGNSLSDSAPLGSINRARWPAEVASRKASVLYGDPAKDGLFVLRLKLPKGYAIPPPHTHPKPEIVTVISGTFTLGMGNVADESNAKPLPAGSFFAFEPGMAHYAFTDEETVVQINSTGPWGINYVNPKDDPRQKTQ